jgi:hypothetical protein
MVLKVGDMLPLHLVVIRKTEQLEENSFGVGCLECILCSLFSKKATEYNFTSISDSLL